VNWYAPAPALRFLPEVSTSPQCLANSDSARLFLYTFFFLLNAKSLWTEKRYKKCRLLNVYVHQKCFCSQKKKCFCNASVVKKCRLLNVYVHQECFCSLQETPLENTPNNQSQQGLITVYKKYKHTLVINHCIHIHTHTHTHTHTHIYYITLLSALSADDGGARGATWELVVSSLILLNSWVHSPQYSNENTSFPQKSTAEQQRARLKKKNLAPSHCAWLYCRAMKRETFLCGHFYIHIFLSFFIHFSLIFCP